MSVPVGTRPPMEQAAPPQVDGPMAAYQAQVDDNTKRRRLRIRLLLFSLPVVGLILVVVFKLLSLSVIADTAIALHNQGAYASSATVSGSLLEQNYFEPWIPYFDRGSARASGEKYVRAIDDLEKALALAPDNRKCMVSVNLALSWETLADGYASVGSFSGATLLYQTAKDVLAAAGPDCAPPQDPVEGRDPSEDRDEAEGRVEQKLQQADGARQQQDAAEDGPTTEQERLDELKDQGDAAAGQKADDDTRGRSDDGGSSYTDKPW